MKGVQKVSIATFHSPELLLRLHPSLARHMNVTTTKQCLISAGLGELRVPCVVDSDAAPTKVLLSEAAARRLKTAELLEELPAQMGDDMIALGPMIGILGNPAWSEAEQRLRSSRYLSVLEKLVKTGEQEGAFCFVFRMRDVNFHDLSVTGHVWSGESWRQVNLPLPDVVYDQVISRRTEQSDQYAVDRARLAEIYGGRIFNDGFLDKWTVYEWLRDDPRTHPYVPITTQYRRVREAVEFLAENGTAFFKPVHGSLGLGIMRFETLVDGTVQYDFKRPKRPPIHGKAPTLRDAVVEFHRRLASKPYIMQRGIELATYENRPFDLRIVLQRDGRARWMRTKTYARVAKEGEFTSNLTTGGEALPVSAVLATLCTSQDDQRRCFDTIKKVCRTVADVVESRAGKRFGELGIDVGLDTRGGVWIIEVNSKPWKAPSTVRGHQEVVDVAFTRPIQYAMWLAKNEPSAM